MEHHYSKGEIDEKFNALGSKMEHIHEDVKETKMQAIKTNGRVSKLENWRWLLMGMGAVIVSTLVPLIIYVYTHQIR